MLQATHFTDILCYEQKSNVKISVLITVLALDEGKTEAQSERGQTGRSMCDHEMRKHLDDYHCFIVNSGHSLKCQRLETETYCYIKSICNVTSSQSCQMNKKHNIFP